MKYLILPLLMSATMSCKKNCVMPTQIIGTGEIIPNALVYQPLITWEMKDKEHIIKSASQNVYNLKAKFDNGASFDTINFNRYTLLGKYVNGSCSVVFERNVTNDDTSKKIYYKIKSHQCGTCKTNTESMNWVLIPRVPDGHDITFIIEP